MTRIKQFFMGVADWLFVGKRLPVILVAFIIVACTITITVVSYFNKTETELVTAYVTIEGFGDDVDFENRQIKIEDGATVADIFSLKYEDIYESFGKPLVQYNAFATFMGVRADADTSFQVTIDGVHDSNLTQAYVYGGQTLKIQLMKK